MTPTAHDDFLWDRSGPVDSDVAALENLLARYRWRGEPKLRERRPSRWLIVAAALLAGIGGVLWWSGDADPLPGEVRIADETGKRVMPGTWLEAYGRDRTLVIGDVGHVVVAAGGRIEVREARIERTMLFVERGRIEAEVSTEAPARFFQVGTPVTVCVDLGCRYVLEVDPVTATTSVTVTLGRVALESEGRTAHVPRRATARADAERGLGTPRDVDLPVDLRTSLDAYDGAASGSVARREAATEFCRLSSMERDTLSLWHMLFDADPEVRRMAEVALIRIAGLPPGAMQQKMPFGIDPKVWFEHVERLWW